MYQVIVPVLIILLVVSAVVFYRFRSQGISLNSFWDFVRNPDAMPNIDEHHQELERIAADLVDRPDDIAAVVDFVVFEAQSERQAWSELQLLGKLHEKRFPRVLEILRDPTLKDELLLTQDNEYSFPEGPINRVCRILDWGNDTPPHEAAKLLSPYLDEKNKEIRKDVAAVIGSIASMDALDDIRKALNDDEPYVKSYVLNGLISTINRNQIDPSVCGELFETVSAKWPDDTDFEVSEYIPNVLLGLDHDRGLNFLLQDELFTIKFEPCWRILQAFHERSIMIERHRIKQVLDEAASVPLEYPVGNVFEYGLPLLGAHRNTEDLQLLERLVDHENEDVSGGAIEALYQFHRYYDRIRDYRDIEEQNGWNALNKIERHIFAVELLDMEINNGGFAQYYFNSTAESWPDALEGLKAMGASKRHNLLLETIAEFGDEEPSIDRQKRDHQLAKIVRKHEDPFHRQDSAWYKTNDENLEKLIFKYNMANLDGRYIQK